MEQPSNNSKAPKTFHFLSSQRTALMGFSMFWIMLFHSPLNLAEKPVIGSLYKVISYGNLGVDIFLLLSGIGLYYSCCGKRQDHWVAFFYKKRLLRLVPSMVICLVPWFLYLVMREQDVGVLQFLLCVTTMDFWAGTGGTAWYISLTIVLYLLYPLIHRLVDPNNSRRNWANAVLCIGACITVNSLIDLLFPEYFNKVEIALGRIPVFLAGCFLGPAVRNKTLIDRNGCAICGTIICLGLMALELLPGAWLGYAIGRYIMGAVGACLAIVIAMMMEYGRNSRIVRFFAFIGQYTLEIYLIHEHLLQVLVAILQPNGRLSIVLITYTLAIILSLLLAVSIGKLAATMTGRKNRTTQTAIN